MKNNQKVMLEVVLVCVLGVVTFFVAGYFDLLERFIEYSHAHEDWELDEILITSVVLVFALVAVLYRRTRELKKEIQRRRQSESEFARLARTDPLTNLLNRRYFLPKLHESVQIAIRQDRNQAVLFVDIDDFKKVNDEFGHAVGDELLVIVSNVLRSSVNSSDLVSRIAGDEFVVHLSSIQGIGQVVRVAEDIISKVCDAHHSGVSLSIGIALMPRDASSAEELLAAADKAMYSAKQKGKNQYALLSEDSVEGVA